MAMKVYPIQRIAKQDLIKWVRLPHSRLQVSVVKRTQETSEEENDYNVHEKRSHKICDEKLPNAPETTTRFMLPIKHSPRGPTVTFHTRFNAQPVLVLRCLVPQPNNTTV